MECVLESPGKRILESWKTLEFGLCKSCKVLQKSIFMLSVRTLSTIFPVFCDVVCAPYWQMTKAMDEQHHRMDSIEAGRCCETLPALSTQESFAVTSK